LIATGTAEALCLGGAFCIKKVQESGLKNKTKAIAINLPNKHNNPTKANNYTDTPASRDQFNMPFETTSC
jgi:hypothetical protein